MSDFDKMIESLKSVKYKCYVATYYRDVMYDMEFHNLEIWKNDFKNDTTRMVIHATLEKEPTEEELLEHIKHYIERSKK